MMKWSKLFIDAIKQNKNENQNIFIKLNSKGFGILNNKDLESLNAKFDQNAEINNIYQESKKKEREDM